MRERWLGDCKFVPFNSSVFEAFWASISSISPSLIVLGWKEATEAKECLGCGKKNPTFVRAYDIEGEVSIIPICEDCHNWKERRK
jgi:hypothetical protein